MVNETRSILFRAELSNELGMGHIIRCLAITKVIQERIEPSLVLKDSEGSDGLVRPLEGLGWKIHFIPEGIDDRDDAGITAGFALDDHSRIIITDLCHRHTVYDEDRLVEYHNELRQLCDRPIISIEDSRLRRYSSDFAILWNSTTDMKNEKTSLNGCRIFSGLDYFICSPEITSYSAREKNIPEKATKLFVCIGGTDPKNVTTKVVQSFELLNDPEMMFKVVLGPTVPEAQRDIIDSIAGSNDNIEIVPFSDSIAELLHWADIAIVGEGIIKFEASIMGTPSIFISQFDENSGPIKDFIRLGTSIHLGSDDGLKIQDIRDAIDRLRSDKEKRVEMSSNGKKKIDGKGLQRIYQEIIKQFL